MISFYYTNVNMKVIFITNTHSTHISAEYSNQENVKPHGNNFDVLTTKDGKKNTKGFSLFHGMRIDNFEEYSS